MISIALLLLSQAPLAPSPYLGQESRAIKALSADELRGLREGAGLGLAKAAELNGYPGPRHVLELAEELELSPAQKEQTQLLFEEMRAEAIEHGARVIEEERKLDALFSTEAIDEAALSTQLAGIAAARGRLRAAHLKAHLKMKAVLSAHQTMRYIQLRGYASGTHSDGHH